MIYVQYQGRLGNQLFQYALGRSIAERLCYELVCRPLPGFPGTDDRIGGKRFEKFVSVSGHKLDLELVERIRNNSGLLIHGFFQRYEYYQRDKQKIKWWFNRGWSPEEIHPDDVVVHVRRTQDSGLDTKWAFKVMGGNIVTENDCFPVTDRSREALQSNIIRASRDILPFEYYESILDNMEFRRLHICTDVPNDTYLRYFRKYSPIIRRAGVLQDFNFMRSAPRIITSISTMSWWAALLSHAEEVYLPYPSFGTWNTAATGVDLRVTDEPRYKIVSLKREGSFF